MVGSDPPPGMGSVIEMPDAMSPATSGRSQRSRWRSVPNRSMVCMLPSSGASTRRATGPSRLRPAASNAGSASRKAIPSPPYSVDTWGA